MELLDLVRRALEACGKVLRVGRAIQEPTRKEFINRLQKICSNCESAYGAVLERLVVVKDSMHDPTELSKQLRSFAADTKTRDVFKPEHLCSDIDHLVVALASNLDALKYSVDFSRLAEIRKALLQIGNVDAAIYDSYDQFAKQLDQLATQLTEPKADVGERTDYASGVISDFEDQLRSTVDSVRGIKKSIVQVT